RAISTARGKCREASADSYTSGPTWRPPKNIPVKLAKVADFSLEFLPPSIAPWVGDISERLQCPLDYVAVTALTALGALIGRRVGIKPQQKTDWHQDRRVRSPRECRRRRRRRTDPTLWAAGLA